MDTNFQFRSSAFNCTETRDYFINEGCFGDDFGAWLIERLRVKGFVTSPVPKQEDFGWYITFKIDDVEHCIVIS